MIRASYLGEGRKFEANHREREGSETVARTVTIRIDIDIPDGFVAPHGFRLYEKTMLGLRAVDFGLVREERINEAS